MTFLVPDVIKAPFLAILIPFTEKPTDPSALPQYTNACRTVVTDTIMALFRVAVGVWSYSVFQKALGTISLSSAWSHKLITVGLAAVQWLALSGPSLLITMGATAIKNAGPELSKAFASRSFNSNTGYAIAGVALGTLLLSSFAKKYLGSYPLNDDGSSRFTGALDLIVEEIARLQIAYRFYPAQ